MAWTPISGTPPQYSTAANALAQDYYLKFYAANTTTPINMATDSTGGTQLAQCALSDDGYPITNPLDDTTKFIPHIDQDYRLVLYKNKTDADNNATGSAAFNINPLSPNIAPSADAIDIALRDTTLEAQDDYDRSPLFVDGTDFTAGAGPHVITVPSGWDPSNADVRFYKLDSAGIVTPLTPTSTTSTTFTLAETLLSTDTIFIGDDDFRNQMDGDPADARTRLGVYSTAQTDTLLDGKQDIAADVASFNKSATHFQYDGVLGPVFDVVANLSGPSTFETIGPTGSGATHIWTALDTLPADAKYIDFAYESEATASPAITTLLEIALLVATTSGGSYRMESGVTADTISSVGARDTARIRLDANNVFRVAYASVGATTTDVKLTGIIGFGL